MPEHPQTPSAESGRRVAIFVPSLAGGGAERVMATVANGISALGHPVDLVLARRSGPYLDEVAPRVRIIDLKASRMATAILPLSRYLRKERPPVLLSALMYANVAAVLAATLAGRRTRVVVSERDAIFPPGASLAARLQRELTAGLYRLASAVIAVSEGVRADLIRELRTDPGKVVTLHNPLDIDAIELLATEPVGHRWFQTCGAPVFLAVGRLEPAKGFDVLLEAFAKVRAAATAKLVVLGEGSLRGDLVERARSLGVADDVDFAGFQSNPFAWMSRCNVFVLSSRNEGLPNALIQAMVCGARVVSTDCPHGPAEILEEGRWGSLVPVGDPDALAIAMRDTVASTEAPCVRERAQDFSQARLVGKYLAVLQAHMAA